MKDVFFTARRISPFCTAFSVALYLYGVRSLGAPDDTTLKVADKLVAIVPEPWLILPAQTRNLFEVALPATPKQPATEQVRVAITTETRTDHASAVQRIAQIAAEREGQIRYLDICGWPALERRSIVALAHTRAPKAERPPRPTPSIRTTVVTVAPAADDKIVRYEGALQPSAPAAVADEAAALAHTLHSAA